MSVDDSARPEPIGGALVLIVGPSGAGKDTILRGARTILADEPRIRFPRRVVTREPDASEDNATMSEHEFMARRMSGGFLLDWQAHGLSYGVPIAVVDDLRVKHVVVVNASRTVVASARSRISGTRVVLVTAPREVRAQRLADRGRDHDPEQRLTRDIGYEYDLQPDVVIDNAGPIGAAVSQLVCCLRAAADAIGDHRVRG